MYRVVPVNDLLYENELAFLIDDKKVVSVTNDSICKLMELFRLEPYFYKEFKNSDSIVMQAYRDYNGNSIIVEYKPAIISMEYEDCEIKIQGFEMNPYGLWIERSGGSTILDLRDIIKIYPQNVFEDAVNRLKDYFIKRSKEKSYII